VRDKITPELEYIRKIYAPEDELLVEIRTELARQNMQIQIGSEEGRLLQLLIAMNNIKTIVEIGTLAGYSTIWMARALPKDGHIYTINRDEKHIQMAKHFFAKFECHEKITMLEGDACEVLPALTSSLRADLSTEALAKGEGEAIQSFELSGLPRRFAPRNDVAIDMIFIDADKISYNEYLDWAEENLRVGGLLVADNTLLSGSVAADTPPSNRRIAAPTTWQNMRKFNERLADKVKYNATMIPTREGLTVAIKL